jgi:hypothetical protein
MRFISMIRIEENTGQVPSEQLMSDMGKLIDELTRAGQLISTAGLRPTSEGVRVRLRRGKVRSAAAGRPGVRQRGLMAATSTPHPNPLPQGERGTLVSIRQLQNFPNFK